MTEYGLFNGESEDYTAEQAVEAGFYSEEEAARARAVRYEPDDCLEIHKVEETGDEDDEDDEDDD